MNTIDVLLCIVILYSVIQGWRNGFIYVFLALAEWLISLWAGFKFYKQLADVFQEHGTPIGTWSNPVAFVLIVFVAKAILSVISLQIIKSTSKETHKSFLNKAMGTLPGAVNGLVTAALLATLLLMPQVLPEQTRDSRIANRLTKEVAWAEQKFSPVFEGALKMGINEMTMEPQIREIPSDRITESDGAGGREIRTKENGREIVVTEPGGNYRILKNNERILYPFKVANPTLRPELEREMLDLINEERAKAGVPPLKADPEMAVVARKHSKDMYVQGYFSHQSLDGRSPFDRMEDEEVSYQLAGENISHAQTLALSHQGLMFSTGHRKNILRKDFGRVGIGIYDGGKYGIMVTQNFRN